MKIAIAILNLGSRAMERYGDFFQIKVPNHTRLPHVFRHNEQGKTEDERYYFLPGQEAKYTACLERLGRDPKYRDRTLVTLAVPTLTLDEELVENAKKLSEADAKIKELESELERLQKAAPPVTEEATTPVPAVIVEPEEVKDSVIDSEPIQETPAPETPVETVTEQVTTPEPVTETPTKAESEAESSHVVTGELPEEAPETSPESVTEEATTPAKKAAKKQPKKKGAAVDDANKPE